MPDPKDRIVFAEAMRMECAKENLLAITSHIPAMSFQRLPHHLQLPQMLGKGPHFSNARKGSDAPYCADFSGVKA
eukprot:9849617-Alexandrium_andersonii.AAC.1